MNTLLALAAVLAAGPAPAAPPPNVVIVLADDLGYADIGCFGATKWKTPHLDTAAKAGVRFTHFRVAQPVCSASRAALLTGCYPNRVGIARALPPWATNGLAGAETTLGHVCRSKGYATAAVGKWHLGHRPAFLPTRRGFDSYFGLPYSNDMWPHPPAAAGLFPPLPLFENEKIVNPAVSAAVQDTLTADYTARAVNFVKGCKGKPFFLYLAHTMPHVPLFPGAKFRGSSGAGAYGDVIQEIDWSVGEVRKAVAEIGAADNTLFIFTSDNGPWLSYGNHAGSAGPLREGKGTAFEGGLRVPFVATWPAGIPAGKTCDEPAMTIDLLPTIAKLIGAALPKLRIDGNDIFPLLKCEPGAKSPQEAYAYYYEDNELHAVSAGTWKLTLPHTARTMQGQAAGADGVPGKYKPLKVPQALYDLAADPAETTDVSAARPDQVKVMLGHAEAFRADLGDALTNRPGPGRREPGREPK